MIPAGKVRRLVLTLGTAQTLAWASSYYLPGMLAKPMADSLGLQTSTIYAALSMALLMGAFISPAVGRWVDQQGGRRVLMLSNLLFVAGLLLLAASTGLWTMLAAWVLLGLAMGCGLYDPAFATLVHLLGPQARRSISGITLLAGFASTVGWPLSALMESQFGWRGACVGWALLHGLLGLPLNAMLPRQRWQAPAAPVAVAAGAAGAATPMTAPVPRPGYSTWLAPLMSLLFVCMSFVSASISTHLPTILQLGGLSLAAAVSMAALAGPAQVAGRLLELGVLQRNSPLTSARVAAAGHPLAALALLAGGVPWALPFVLLHGVGNGIITIVRGTLPLAIFGAQGYGSRQGWLNLPSRVLGALAPWFFGLLLQHQGVSALWATAAAGCTGLLLLLWISRLQTTHQQAGGS